MVVIRAALPEDAHALVHIYNPYVTNTTVSYEWDPVSESEFSRRVSQKIHKYPYLVAEENGVCIGFAYAGAFRSRQAYQWDVELSIYVDERYHGKGIGTMFMEKLLDILKRMHYVNVYALIDYPNESSMALHKHFGFAQVGELKATGFKLGKWCSTVILEKRLSNPAKPLPLDSDWKKFM